MGILDKRTYKKIEYYLYNYHELRREVNEAKEDIINEGRQMINNSGSGISYHSDPTAAKAIRLCKGDIIEQEKWLKVIENVIRKFSGTGKGRLLQKKYFDELGENHICKELYIGRTTFFQWKDEIVMYAALLAVQSGMIKIK